MHRDEDAGSAGAATYPEDGHPRIGNETLVEVRRNANQPRTRQLLACYGIDLGAETDTQRKTDIGPALHAAIRLRNPEREAALLRILGEAEMDSASAAVLRAIGLSPVDVHVITVMGTAGRFHTAAGRIIAVVQRRTCRISAPIAPGFIWRARTRRTLQLPSGYPLTMLQTYRGRPLRDLIRHPATDGLGLVVSEIETREDGNAYAIMDGEADAVDLATML